MLLLSFFLPSSHDYALYLEQWRHILAGNDPWVKTLNAYGPMYSFMARLVGIHERLPALIFLAVYFLGIFFFIRDSGLTPNWNSLILLLVNPLFFIFGLLYSSNDVLLAGVILLFLMKLEMKHFAIAGVFLGLAVSFKFSVIFLVPLLFLQEKKWIPGSVLSFGLTLLLFYGLAYLIWGETFLIPFLYGADRESRLLSVFRFIRGDLQPLAFAGISSLDSLNTLFLGTGALITWLLLVRLKVEDVYVQATAFLVTVFMIYKVGNHQYFLTVFPLLVILVQKYPDFRLRLGIGLISAWYSFAALLYYFTRHDSEWGYSGKFFGIREWIGLPTFLVQITFLIILFTLSAAGNFKKPEIRPYQFP